QPVPRVRNGERHRGKPFGGGMHDDHRVPLPRLARPPVPDAAPEVDDFPAAPIRATRAAQLVTPGEVLGKRVESRLAAAFGLALNVRIADAEGRSVLRAKGFHCLTAPENVLGRATPLTTRVCKDVAFRAVREGARCAARGWFRKDRRRARAG